MELCLEQNARIEIGCYTQSPKLVIHYKLVQTRIYNFVVHWINFEGANHSSSRTKKYLPFLQTCTTMSVVSYLGPSPPDRGKTSSLGGGPSQLGISEALTRADLRSLLHQHHTPQISVRDPLVHSPVPQTPNSNCGSPQSLRWQLPHFSARMAKM